MVGTPLLVRLCYPSTFGRTTQAYLLPAVLQFMKAIITDSVRGTGYHRVACMNVHLFFYYKTFQFLRLVNYVISIVAVKNIS